MSPGQVGTGHVSADQENASQENASQESASPEIAPEARQEAAPGRGPEATAAIVTSGLTKRFRSGQLAVDGIDMVVPQGSVYGFLGPNGSGKTTTIRMLLGRWD